jgi:hypothetical protein
MSESERLFNARIKLTRPRRLKIDPRHAAKGDSRAEVDVLRWQGMGIRAIRREAGLARNIIRAILRGEHDDQYGPRKPRPTKSLPRRRDSPSRPTRALGTAARGQDPDKGRGPGSDRSQSEDREPDVFAPSVLSLGKSHGLLHKTSQMSGFQLSAAIGAAMLRRCNARVATPHC